MTGQSAGNHAHHPIPTYAATVFWVAGMAMLAGALAFGWPLRDWGVLLLGLSLFPVIGIGRWYTVKLQDRIIQLEMQVRCARLLPAGPGGLPAQLSPEQGGALPVAPADGLRGLPGAAVREQMTPTAIKQAVKQWRPDYLRT